MQLLRFLQLMIVFNASVKVSIIVILLWSLSKFSAFLWSWWASQFLQISAVTGSLALSPRPGHHACAAVARGHHCAHCTQALLIHMTVIAHVQCAAITRDIHCVPLHVTFTVHTLRVHCRYTWHSLCALHACSILPLHVTHCGCTAVTRDSLHAPHACRVLPLHLPVTARTASRIAVTRDSLRTLHTCSALPSHVTFTASTARVQWTQWMPRVMACSECHL